LPVIIVSNKADTRKAVECIHLGAFDFIDKMDAKTELPIAIANALKLSHLQERTRRLEEENRIYRAEAAKAFGFDRLVGGSEPMRELYHVIERVADTDASILILGETGTGKELVAGAIHQASRRHQGPFIKVNCAALPESLLEDELFGHEKGAYTGAQARRAGRFELADGGTLFLDEIGDMSLATQAKVLRVLQEQEFERVGGSRTVHVDVRIVAATNQDIREMIAKGQFREDLYYRLKDIAIELPPLRDRRDDIPLLVQHFLAEFAERYRGRKLSNEAMRILLGYDWPGNIRELKAVLKNACILARDEIVGVADLPKDVVGRGHPTTPPAPILVGKTLDDVEKLMIVETLKETQGNRSEAARMLGLTWQSLDRRLKKHNIAADDQ
ncbi:MAG: sigma-54 dependent transcriptional regulator, partial [Bacillota bacterium]